MSPRPPRRLVSIQRALGDLDRAAYDAAWLDVRRAAEAGGAHVWRFRAARAPDVFLEFLEFADGADPRRDPECAARLRHLAHLAAGEVAEWVED